MMTMLLTKNVILRYYDGHEGDDVGDDDVGDDVDGKDYDGCILDLEILTQTEGYLVYPSKILDSDRGITRETVKPTNILPTII